jgi:hypothetical protein
MRRLLVFIPIITWALTANALSAQTTPLPHAHAHNDYEHVRPLLDALENGFTSVEADIYLIDQELYVSHNPPTHKDSNRTLRKLYLEPLLQQVKANKGRLYPGYDNFFYLMIDVKSHGDSTYQVLRRQLMEYQDMLSLVRDTIEEQHKPIKVFLSGRAARSLLSETIKIVTLDGRPEDLRQGIPASLMPVVSTSYWKLLTWRGEGAVNPTELQKLRDFVQQAHAERKRVRLWAAPDTSAVWTFLLENGVDIINTDRLSELRQFLLQRKD